MKHSNSSKCFDIADESVLRHARCYGTTRDVQQRPVNYYLPIFDRTDGTPFIHVVATLVIVIDVQQVGPNPEVAHLSLRKILNFTPRNLYKYKYV